MHENLLLSLQLLGQGMLGIFVVLGIIALSVIGLQNLDQKKAKK